MWSRLFCGAGLVPVSLWGILGPCGGRRQVGCETRRLGSALGYGPRPFPVILSGHSHDRSVARRTGNPEGTAFVRRAARLAIETCAFARIRAPHWRLLRKAVLEL